MVSKIKVDEIESSQSGGTIALNSSMKLKNYTTTEMNALSGMAAGDTIYNETEGTLYVYNGVGWFAMSSGTFVTGISYLVIAGGGSGGGSDGGGGGAGGYRSAYNSESSGGGNASETALEIDTSTNYTVTVGAGGSNSGSTIGTSGSNSTFFSVTSIGGGYGGGGAGTPPSTGGSGGGGDNDAGGGTGHIGAAGTAN